VTNLPAQVSTFIGRAAELAEVRRLVSGSRLVTLTGAGGAGKTRLGLQAAAGLADGAGDGVWFADLAPLGDPGLVAVTVADVLGVRQAPGRPVLDTLVEAISGRSLLILLDNCEHVIGACAKLADALLRGCPNLALLATSREPLGVDGERVYRVPSMGTPADGDGTEAIQASEAVRLLADRAAAQGVPLVAADQAAWLDRLDAELGNLRAAIAFSLTRPDPAPGLRLAGSLRVYWLARGHAAEAADALQALLDKPTAPGATLARAQALAAAANLVERTGSYATAEDYCEEALAIARSAGDDHLVAELLHTRAWVSLRQGQPGAALPLIEQGLSLARRLREARLTALLLSARSHAVDLGGDHAAAARDAAEALRSAARSVTSVWWA
jgi:predicted ATPase